MSKTEYTVRTPFKLGGRWHQQGARVMLTDAEALAYAGSLADGPEAATEAAGPYLPGQEPQTREIDPLTVAQAATGDPVAIADVEGRTESPAEARGDIVDEAAEAAGYETNEAAAASTRPVTPAKPKPSK